MQEQTEQWNKIENLKIDSCVYTANGYDKGSSINRWGKDSLANSHENTGSQLDHFLILHIEVDVKCIKN